MNITEVRVKLMRNRSDRLRAFCSITIDGDFVVHDLRVIEGRKGLFVAMPSRKLTDNCPRCSAKNELRAKFCGECGGALSHDRTDKATAEKSHVDVAHPINTPCRDMLQGTVLAAYREEVQSAGEDLSTPEGAPVAEFDDSSDEPAAETGSRWAESEVAGVDLLPGDIPDEQPSAAPVEPEAVPEDEPADQPADDFAAFELPAAEDDPATDVPEEDPVADVLPAVPLGGPADEPLLPAAEPEAPAGPEGAREEPAEDRDAEPQLRSKPAKKAGGFGEGIL